jgi:hypothetical protein
MSPSVQGYIEYTVPEKPNSRLQKYRLTQKGELALKCLQVNCATRWANSGPNFGPAASLIRPRNRRQYTAPPDSSDQLFDGAAIAAIGEKFS